MAQIVINADGEYFLPTGTSGNVTAHAVSTVMIKENSAGATTEYGLADENDNFVAYPNGVIPVGDIILHGIGIKLMVRVSGITSDSVTIDVARHI
jgi:hypothetical protein